MPAWRVECIPAWAVHTPTLYVAARFMWDVDTDVDALLAGFYPPSSDPPATHGRLPRRHRPLLPRHRLPRRQQPLPAPRLRRRLARAGRAEQAHERTVERGEPMAPLPEVWDFLVDPAGVGESHPMPCGQAGPTPWPCASSSRS